MFLGSDAKLWAQRLLITANQTECVAFTGPGFRDNKQCCERRTNIIAGEQR